MKNMKVLIVCSGNTTDFNFMKHQAFIYDQIESVSNLFPDVIYDTYFIRGRGFMGYLSNLKAIKKKIDEVDPQIIHAHGGHVGLFCSMQKRIPVVITFHGSDINNLFNRFLSMLASVCSTASIFVSKKLKKKAIIRSSNSYVIPCGVNYDIFYPILKAEAKRLKGINVDENYILFGSSFNNKVKNYPLAEKALEKYKELSIREIKDRTRSEVNLLLNGAELLLLTSFSEGSPQIIKEAMACNIPIVSVDVGDVKQVVGDTEGTYICSYDPGDISEKIKKALTFGKRTNGRDKINCFDNIKIAKNIYLIYREVMHKRVLN